MHGLQLWIALPGAQRHTGPRFAHHAGLPVVREGSARVTVAIGEYRGERSPAQVCSPLAGFEVAVPGGDDATLAVRPDFEYGVIAADGSALIQGALITPGLLAHLPPGLSRITLSPATGRLWARFFVIGGAPFAGRLLMWWNFVARTGEEIAQAREDWTGLARRSPWLRGRAAGRPRPARDPAQGSLTDPLATCLIAGAEPYWRGTGSLAAGTCGAGLVLTSCWAVSSPAAAEARVRAAGDRG